MSTGSWLDGVDAALLRSYDRPGPRYTSYPTAPVWKPDFEEAIHRRHLAAADERPDAPLSVYVHVPFCKERCTFCGCNVVVTKHQGAADRYIDALAREMDLVQRDLRTRRNVIQLHIGGGTPTFLSPEQLERLGGVIRERFTMLDGAELSIEIDPTVTTRDHIATLRGLGFNRVSLGVQDFDMTVLSSVNRPQTVDVTREIYDACREAGFTGVNFDLIYGLPNQSPEAFRYTREIVREMRPDRLAVYSYAHVPWIKGHQRRIDEATLPSVDDKFQIYLDTIRDFVDAGYEQIGMDHYALPEDELAVARREKRLHRNFMGYTTRPAQDMLAFGISSISYVQNAFTQNGLVLKRYYESLDRDELPVHRGYVLDDDDLVRAEVIRELMCNFEVRFDAIREHHGVHFLEYFDAELEELGDTIDPDFFALGSDRLEVTPRGRLFVRNLCMLFDRYLTARPDDKPIFSRTI